MRTLLLSLLVAAPAGAQTFRLTDPALTVDNRRVGVAGAPIVQEPFGVLALSLPGTGVFRVAAAPFAGAAAAGEFDGDGLFFAVDGTSVRLRSAGPILEGRATTPAFVRFDALAGATPRSRATGLARVSVSDVPGGTPRSSAALDVQTSAPRGPAPVGRTAPGARAEADALRQTLDRVRAERAALEAERDRLAGDVARLSTDLAAERATSAALRTGAPALGAPALSAPAAAPVARPGVPGASFPGFDFERLANPDAVRRRADEAAYPRWAAEGRITGDVLVLFETDPSGRVIRTAVASPIGGGLDGLAESLVRDMQFVPPTVGGVPTSLRSQVLVRFTL